MRIVGLYSAYSHAAENGYSAFGHDWRLCGRLSDVSGPCAMSHAGCAVGEHDWLFKESGHGGIDRLRTRRNATALSFAGGEGIAGHPGHDQEDVQ